jgi:hypothetical protein
MNDVLRTLVSKFLPWKLALAQQAIEHANSGTVPSTEEAVDFVKKRRTRIIVGSGVAAGAATATFLGAPGFAEDGIEGQLIDNTRHAAASIAQGNWDAVPEQAQDAIHTLRRAVHHAVNNPQDVPAYVIEEKAEEAARTARNMALTVGLIEAGRGLAGATRRAKENGSKLHNLPQQITTSQLYEPSADAPRVELPSQDRSSSTPSPPPSPPGTANRETNKDRGI